VSYQIKLKCMYVNTQPLNIAVEFYEELAAGGWHHEAEMMLPFEIPTLNFYPCSVDTSQLPMSCYLRSGVGRWFSVLLLSHNEASLSYKMIAHPRFATDIPEIVLTYLVPLSIFSWELFSHFVAPQVK
jgi:hypothetical protein